MEEMDYWRLPLPAMEGEEDERHATLSPLRPHADDQRREAHALLLDAPEPHAEEEDDERDETVMRILLRISRSEKYTPGYWKAAPNAYVRDAMVYARLVERRFPEVISK